MTELSIYIQIIRRWLWLIILSAVIAASVGFAAARLQPVRYQASTILQVGTYSSLLNPTNSMLQTSETLTATYIALLRTRPILEGVVNRLALTIGPDALDKALTARQITGTSLIKIDIVNTDPVAAADIANELANQIIANSPTRVTQDQQDQLDLLRREIKDAETRLDAARSELKVIEANIGTAEPADQAILSARKTELLTEISAAQSNIATMSSTLAGISREGSANSITVVEPARIPDSPIGLSTFTNALLAGVVGAMAGAAAGFAFEYLNNTIRSPGEITPLLSLPVLGAILAFGNKRSYEKKLVTWLQPRSTIAEAYRALRVNLLFRSNEQDNSQFYILTSCGPGEGKSVTAANLAITFAVSGMRVLLLDSDLRRPVQHKLFSLPNTFGLSDIWVNSNGLPRSVRNGAHAEEGKAPTQVSLLEKSVQLYLSQLTQKTEIPGLDIITAGPLTNNPIEIIETPQMKELINQVKQSKNYDVIIVDSPPALVVTDTSVLAKVMNAKAILVIEAGGTGRATARRAVEQLTELAVPIVGVVINRLNPRNLDTGYGQYYYGYTKYTSPS